MDITTDGTAAAGEDGGFNSKQVTLAVDSTTLTCSRKILVENSAYFRTMFCPDHNGFSESKQEVITLKGVDSQALGVILECLSEQTDGHVGRLLHKEFSPSVLVTSAMLQFETVFKQCVEMASSSLSIENCLQYMASAEQLGAMELHCKARFLAFWEFSLVCKTSAFLELTLEDVENYLSSDMLHATSEMKVVEAALMWVEGDLEARREHLERLLHCARWHTISMSDLRTLTLYPSIAELPTTLGLIRCIISLTAKTIESSACDGQISHTSMEKIETATVSDDIQDMSHVTMDVSGNLSSSSGGGAEDDPGVLQTAMQLLALPLRQPPQVPCFIGHRLGSIANKNSSNFGELSDMVPSLGFFHPDKLQLETVVDITKVQSGHKECTGYSVISIGKGVYVLGGERLLGHGDWNLTMWCYDILNKDWSSVGRLQHPRRHFSVCTLGDEIFLIGGCGRHRIITDCCDAFSTARGSWRKCAPLPESLYSAACCSHTGRIFIVGSQVHCYTPSLNLWCTLNNLKLPGHMGFHSAMSHQKHIYLTGKYTTALMRFNPEEAERGLNLNFDYVGDFKNKTHKSCIVGDCIYVFSDDGEGKLTTEMFDICKNEFTMVWSSNQQFSQAGFVDFMPEQSSGCFPLIKCWLN